MFSLVLCALLMTGLYLVAGGHLVPRLSLDLAKSKGSLPSPRSCPHSNLMSIASVPDADGLVHQVAWWCRDCDAHWPDHGFMCLGLLPSEYPEDEMPRGLTIRQGARLLARADQQDAVITEIEHDHDVLRQQLTVVQGCRDEPMECPCCNALDDHAWHWQIDVVDDTPLMWNSRKVQRG